MGGRRSRELRGSSWRKRYFSTRIPNGSSALAIAQRVGSHVKYRKLELGSMMEARFESMLCRFVRDIYGYYYGIAYAPIIMIMLARKGEKGNMAIPPTPTADDCEPTEQ